MSVSISYRALSLRQPWTDVVLDLGKTIENRRRGQHLLGMTLIHSAKGCTKQEYAEAKAKVAEMAGEEVAAKIPPLADLARGGISGIAEIIGFVLPNGQLALYASEGRPEPDELRWHMRGQHGYVLRRVRRIPFVPCMGMLGFFPVPGDVGAEVTKNLTIEEQGLFRTNGVALRA